MSLERTMWSSSPALPKLTQMTVKRMPALETAFLVKRGAVVFDKAESRGWWAHAWGESHGVGIGIAPAVFRDGLPQCSPVGPLTSHAEFAVHVAACVGD